MTTLIAILLSVSGAAVFMLQPIYLGALADSLALGGTELGLLAGVETGGALLASLAAPWWARRVSPRQVAALAMLVAGGGNLVCLFVDNFPLLLFVRGTISLFGAGLAYAVAFLLLAFATNRERAYSLAVFAQVAFGAAGLVLLPPAIEKIGVDAIFFVIAALAFLTLPLVGVLSRMPLAPPSEAAQRQPLSRVTLLLLSAQVVWFAGIGGVWAFIERIGNELGLAPGDIGTALSAGTAISLLASLLAAWMAARLGTRWQMPLMILAHLATFIALLTGIGSVEFIVSMIVFSFLWNFALPYLLAAIARAEPDGRGAALVPACQTGALMVGPILAGSTVAGGDHSGVLLFAIACYGVLAAIILAATRLTSGHEG